MSKMEHVATEQRTSFTPRSAGLLQRKCDKCSKKKRLLQRRMVDQAGPSAVSPIVHDVLNSPGQPLDPAIRTFFEARLGHDFSKVMVHTDGRAAKSAQSVAASAYTSGQDIVFGPGKYAPKASKGKLLLAHELVHVMQGYQGRRHIGQSKGWISRPSETLELEAGEMAKEVVIGRRLEPKRSDMQMPNVSILKSNNFIQRVQSEDETDTTTNNKLETGAIESSEKEGTVNPFAGDEQIHESPNQPDAMQTGGITNCTEKPKWTPKSPVPDVIVADNIVDFINKINSTYADPRMEAEVKYGLEFTTRQDGGTQIRTVVKVNMELITSIYVPRLGLTLANAKEKALMNKAVNLIKTHETLHRDTFRSIMASAVCAMLGQSVDRAQAILDTYRCETEPTAQENIDVREGGLFVVKDDKGQPSDVKLVGVPKPNYHICPK